MLNYKNQGIQFIDEDHYLRFLDLHGKSRKGLGREYSSCLYILSSSKAIFEKTKSCVTNEGIKVTSLVRKAYSTSEEYLVKIAVVIFNRISDLKLDFYWVVKFDAMQYAVIMEAFNIRRGEFSKN